MTILYAYFSGFISWPLIQYVFYPMIKAYLFGKWEREKEEKQSERKPKKENDKKKRGKK